MTIFWYLFIGMALYPASMNMWYKHCHRTNQFDNPEKISWYLSFITFVLLWWFAFPFQAYHHYKEIK